MHIPTETLKSAISVSFGPPWPCLWPWIGSHGTVVQHSATAIYLRNFVEIDGRTSTGFIGSSRPRQVDPV